jgi:uncharacterized membrane protein YgdD (TMEM256/DUF423 family)
VVVGVTAPDRTLTALGALFGFLGVALGAFGAHALRTRLAPDLLAVFETAVRYQLYHALALLFVGLAAQRLGPQASLAGWLFTGGIALFSGSLYLLSITGARWLGAITPFGGLCFLTGWGLLLWSVLAAKR